MHTALLAASPLTGEPRCANVFDRPCQVEPCHWTMSDVFWHCWSAGPYSLFTISCFALHLHCDQTLAFVSSWSTLRGRALIFEREIELDRRRHMTIGITMYPAHRHHRVHLPALEILPASQHPLPAWQIHQSIHQFPHARDHLPGLGVPVMFALRQSQVSDTSEPISTVAHALEHPVQAMEEAQEDLYLQLLSFQYQPPCQVRSPVLISVMDYLEQTHSVEAAGQSTTHRAPVSGHS